jgi:pullulanase-type alpha-1,6-glucosidase
MKRKKIQLLIAVMLLVDLWNGSPASAGLLAQDEIITCEEAVLHYHRPAGDYEDWGLHIWGPISVTGVTWTTPFMPTGEDDFGLVWQVPMQEEAEYLNYIVHLGDTKDPGPDQQMKFVNTGCEIWIVQGEATQYPNPEDALNGVIPVLDVDFTEAPEVGENQAIIHYHRPKQDYNAWGLHVWGATPLVESVTWTNPLQPAGQDRYGLYFVVDVNEDAESVNYIVHQGDVKDPGPDQKLVFAEAGREIWLVQGSAKQFNNPEDALAAADLAAVGDITQRKAYWVSEGLIIYPTDYDAQNTYALVYSPKYEIQVTSEGVKGAEIIPLSWENEGLPEELAAKFPHLVSFNVFRLPAEVLENVPKMLRGQVGMATWDSNGALKDLTGLQIPGVLDDLFAYDGPLGISWDGDTPTFRLWAPTASFVGMYIYADTDPGTVGIPDPMSFDPETGVWSKEGKPEWKGQYYRYEIDVYMPSEGRVVRNEVTDPYSVGLAMNSTHSLIVDLDDPALLPDGWEELKKPEVTVPEDMVLYELHVRDFSIFDESVPEEARGTFSAFTYTSSDGMKHLRKLAQAGLTHIHLLPAFDIATVNEDKTSWKSADMEVLSALPPDGKEQQALVNETRAADGFNWGYDPYHYTVPEGSYSTDPNGSARILEFREMVMALNESGLRLVMDVVYNHTNASGNSDYAVLDKIVPGYYHRLSGTGVVESSTCCSNTATENHMMNRLMVDSVLTWTTAYRVDGYRFDLMGHHMKENMLDLRQTLNELTFEKDGVEGSEVYVYGEGWNFGEVADNARGVNATQINLAGSGIGTFNDRLRDAARGGNPFGGLQEQGFINGLYNNPNEVEVRSAEEQLMTLLGFSDIIRVTLSGNLADYSFTDYNGETAKGIDLLYNGNPGAGYTADPQENIVYVSAHDNETLFDAIQYKAPIGISVEDRVRMQNMGISLVSLSQGVPFFHAGSELLRSKNMDRDSYDSGDWFNRLDLTYQDNNWGKGLPIADKNSTNWDIMRPLLANSDLKPAPKHIQSALNHFIEMLSIRESSPLFRLQTAEQIKDRVHFHNTGLDQIPGLIVMSIDDRVGENLDPGAEYIVVLFNATDEAWSFELDEEFSSPMFLHPILADAADEMTRSSAYQDGIMYVPAMTTAVFVAEEEVVIDEAPADLNREVNDNQTPLIILGLALIAALAVWLLQKTGGGKEEYIRIGDKF